MDVKWNTHVRPILCVLVEILFPLALIDGLYAAYLITREEYEKIKTYDNAEGSRQLLVTILPRKGPDSFNRFLSVLEVTEGQEHVAELIREGVKCEQEREARKKRKRERIRDLEKELKKEKKEKEETKIELKVEKKERAKDKIELKKEKVTNIGLRTKFSMGSPSLKWETNIPNMPIDYCRPFGRVAEINGMLHVGWKDTMFQFKKGAWEGEEHHLPGIKRIWSVFECEGKGYVMDTDEEYHCSSIYEWKNETKNLELLTKIPDEYQLFWRSAIGHNGNIYLVGGGDPFSDRVDCFDINKGEWEPIKKMKNQQDMCSLAVIDDKMYVGGGGGAENSVECFSMEKQVWIDIKPTTKEWCQLSSWNGKLVATGGWDKGERKCVEMYDELSGVWLPLPSTNEGRYEHGACTTKDNQLIVVGGEGAGNSVECLKM